MHKLRSSAKDFAIAVADYGLVGLVIAGIAVPTILEGIALADNADKSSKESVQSEVQATVLRAKSEIGFYNR